MVYLIGEIMLLSFCLTIARPRHGLVATIVGLQALRIVILILLCGMTLGSRVVPSKKSRDEEESSPLLGQGSQPLNDPQGIQQPPGTGDNNYGSINSVKSPKSGNGNTQADSENPGTDCDDKIKNQSTKDYIKSFTVRLSGCLPPNALSRSAQSPFFCLFFSNFDILSGPSSVFLANW